jgi:hypothetical protein
MLPGVTFRNEALEQARDRGVGKIELLSEMADGGEWRARIVSPADEQGEQCFFAFKGSLRWAFGHGACQAPLVLFATKIISPK